MKAAIVTCVLALLPTLAAADYVATPEEEAALRTRIAKNPPSAETLTAQPYPGAKLDPVCSAAQSAPRQPGSMVYCYYTRDPIDKVQAYLDGPGKPNSAVYVRAGQDPLVDAKNNVIISEVTMVEYYVSSAPAAKQPAAAATPAAAPAPVADAAPAATAPAAASPAQEPAAAKPEDDSNTVEKAVEKGKKLKGLLGF